MSQPESNLSMSFFAVLWAPMNPAIRPTRFFPSCSFSGSGFVQWSCGRQKPFSLTSFALHNMMRNCDLDLEMVEQIAAIHLGLNFSQQRSHRFWRSSSSCPFLFSAFGWGNGLASLDWPVSWTIQMSWRSSGPNAISVVFGLSEENSGRWKTPWISGLAMNPWMIQKPMESSSENDLQTMGQHLIVSTSRHFTGSLVYIFMYSLWDPWYASVVSRLSPVAKKNRPRCTYEISTFLRETEKPKPILVTRPGQHTKNYGKIHHAMKNW